MIKIIRKTSKKKAKVKKVEISSDDYIIKESVTDVTLIPEQILISYLVDQCLDK